MTETTKTLPADYIMIGPEASAQVSQLLAAEQAEHPERTGLRLGIQGGGCSGLSYKISFDALQPNDYVMPQPAFNVYVDPKSAIYLKGVALNYQGGLEGKGFVFSNPNASSTCGCGESFSL